MGFLISLAMAKENPWTSTEFWPEVAMRAIMKCGQIALNLVFHYTIWLVYCWISFNLPSGSPLLLVAVLIHLRYHPFLTIQLTHNHQPSILLPQSWNNRNNASSMSLFQNEIKCVKLMLNLHVCTISMVISCFELQNRNKNPS